MRSPPPLLLACLLFACDGGDDSPSSTGSGEETTPTDDTGTDDGGSEEEEEEEEGSDDTGDPGDPTLPDDALILDHLHVLDANQDLDDHALVIVSDEIWDVVPSRESWPADATVRDLSGHTVIPGLVDAHVHLFHSGSTWWVGDSLPENLQAQLAWGVVGVADLGSPEEVFDLRDRILSGELRGPRVWATGPFLTAEGSHPCESVNDRELCRFVDGDGSAEVVALARADGIKVALADADFTPWPTPRLDVGDLAEIVSTAHSRGQQVWAHVDEIDDVEDAMSAGVDVMAHPIFGATEGTIPDAPLHSTIGAFAGVEDVLSGDLTDDDLTWTPDDVADAWDWLNAHPSAFDDVWVDESATWAATARFNVTQAVTQGRPVMAGTDAGYWFVPHGLGIHRELEELVQAGMSPQEALAAATSVPADHLGWDDLGHLDAGYQASFVILGADPQDDIANTRDIAEVWLDGEQVTIGGDPWISGGGEPDGEFCLDDRDCSGACDLVHHVCQDACSPTYDRHGSCGDTTWCAPQDGLDTTTDGVCQEVEDCDLYDQDCSPSYYGENCVPIDTDTNRCWPSGPRKAGQSCSWSDEETYCEQGSYCSWVNYQCYKLCDPDDPSACPSCTRQYIEGQPWFGICL